MNPNPTNPVVQLPGAPDVELFEEELEFLLSDLHTSIRSAQKYVQELDTFIWYALHGPYPGGRPFMRTK